MRLLLAEDDPANQMVDQTLLARLGHSVDAVSNGEAALARLAQGGYDAVILDCQMPGVDGYETARRIRSGAVGAIDARLPIVALTADASRAVRDQCLAAGMDDCLGKPLKPREMQAALERCRHDRQPDPPSTAPEAPQLVLDPEHWERMRSAPGRAGSLLADFIALFFRDEPGRIAGLAAVAAERNPRDLARAAHTVAGSCAMLGARELQFAALAVERAAAGSRWNDVPRLLEGVDAAWTRLKAELAREGFSLSSG